MVDRKIQTYLFVIGKSYIITENTIINVKTHYNKNEFK